MLKVVLFSSLAFIAGIGIPVMGSINASLGARLESPTFATVILLFVGFIAASLYMLSNGLPAIPRTMPPLYSLMGGFFVVFYVLTITTVAPKIGIGNAIFLALIGQIICTSFIDHYGLLGAIKSQITIKRSVGILLMAIGIYLARRTT